MSSKFFILFVLGFLFSQNALIPSSAPAAAPVCISNQAEYLSKKDQLPKVLQGLESLSEGKMFRLEGMIARRVARAAVKIRMADNKKFVLDVAVAHGEDSLLEEENYISKICLDGQKIKIFPENKTADTPDSYTAKLTGSDGFELNGGTFKQTTALEFARELEEVKNRLGGSSWSSGKTSSGKK